MNKIDSIVSVIIPTYKRITELKTALTSLTEQVYRNIEVVLVSDNYDSFYNAEIQRLVQSFKNMININLIINTENLGSARSRNIGIKNAIGDYITFLDDDDVYLPEKIRSQVTKMIGSNADFSITNLNLYNGKTNRIVDRRRRIGLNKVQNNNQLLKYHIMHHLTGTSTMMFKRSYLNTIGSFDEIDVGDEFFLMEKAIINNGKFLYCDECFVKALVNAPNTGISSGNKKIDGENALYARKLKYRSLFSKEELKFIKCRHHMVMAYTYFRFRKLLKFAMQLSIAFCTSPTATFKLIIGR